MNAFNPGVAVVAGVGPGLGASLARKCAKEGCQLGLLARPKCQLYQFAVISRPDWVVFIWP